MSVSLRSILCRDPVIIFFLYIKGIVISDKPQCLNCLQRKRHCNVNLDFYFEKKFHVLTKSYRLISSPFDQYRYVSPARKYMYLYLSYIHNNMLILFSTLYTWLFPSKYTIRKILMNSVTRRILDQSNMMK